MKLWLRQRRLSTFEGLLLNRFLPRKFLLLLTAGNGASFLLRHASELA